MAPTFRPSAKCGQEQKEKHGDSIKEEIAQLAHGASAMGNSVFLVGSHFRKRASAFVGNEHGVITEPLLAGGMVGD